MRKISASTVFVSLFFTFWVAGARAQSATPEVVGNRGTQTMNPDISAIIDATTGYWQRQPVSLAGDDPNFGGNLSTPSGGFNIQEAELGFASVIDPYFQGNAYLTIGNTGSFGIEEAYLTTTSLPADLQLKVGKFRSSISRENSMHLHMQDFTMRPLINQNFFGVDGLDAPGAQVNWLVPLPFYSLLSVEALSMGPADTTGNPVQTFGGGGQGALTGVADLRSFFPIGEEVSAYWGLDFAEGRSSTVADQATGIYPLGNNLPTQLYGTDLYVKYKPANYSEGFHSLSWTTEYFQRHFVGDNLVPTQNDGGLYTQFVYQLAQRWYLGLRTDFLGLPASQFVRPEQRYSTSLTFLPSEFSKVRFYAQDEVVANNDYPTALPASALAFMLQFEIIMGAHGAHPF